MTKEPPSTQEKQRLMRCALSLAQTSASLGEVPIGAVITQGHQIIATGMNSKERNVSPTGHAEIMAIEAACKVLRSWRLTGCSLYVTLEPCLMCAGAIWQARMDHVVFAARDPKGGAMGSNLDIQSIPNLNHYFTYEEGICAEEASSLLKAFFKTRRREKPLKQSR